MSFACLYSRRLFFAGKYDLSNSFHLFLVSFDDDSVVKRAPSWFSFSFLPPPFSPPPPLLPAHKNISDKVFQCRVCSPRALARAAGLPIWNGERLLGPEEKGQTWSAQIIPYRGRCGAAVTPAFAASSREDIFIRCLSCSQLRCDDDSRAGRNTFGLSWLTVEGTGSLVEWDDDELLVTGGGRGGMCFPQKR